MHEPDFSGCCEYASSCKARLAENNGKKVNEATYYQLEEELEEAHLKIKALEATNEQLIEVIVAANVPKALMESVANKTNKK